MKKIQFIIVTAILSIVGMTSAKAQNYLLDYGPGSIPWCMQMQQQINAISMQNAMMRAQTMAFYQQQAAAATQHLMNNPFQPMPGIVTYDGVYITPDTVNDYHKEQVDCEHCDGGYNTRAYLIGGECKEIRQRCTYCHGNGYVTRTVRND